LGDPIPAGIPHDADGRGPLDVPGRDRSGHLLPGVPKAQRRARRWTGFLSRATSSRKSTGPRSRRPPLPAETPI